METLEGDTWIHWKETRETLEEDTDMECWIGMENSTIRQGAVLNVEKRVENGDGDMVGE